MERSPRLEDGASRGDPISRARWIIVASAVGWVVVATMLQLLRQTGVPATDTLWAEDGSLYLSQALADGPWTHVLSLYSDYMQLAPRLLAVLAAALPLRHAAVVMSGGPAVIVGLLSVYVFVTSRQTIRSAWGRGLVAGLIVVVPVAGWEVMNNSVNLQWYLVFACVWALLDRATSFGRIALGSVVAAMSTLTIPLTILLSPAAIGRLASSRGWRARAIPTVFLVGLGLQLVVMLVGASPIVQPHPADSSTDPLDVPVLYGYRVVEAAVVGQRMLPSLWHVGGAWLALLALVLASAVTVAAVRRGGAARWTPAGLALLSLVLFVVPAVLRGTSLLDPERDPLAVSGSRWTVAPILLFACVAVIAAERRASGWTSYLGPVVVTAALLFGIASSFRIDNLRSAGPRWSVAVSAALDGCSNPTVSVRIPITPPGWRVKAPCTDLVPGRQG